MIGVIIGGIIFVLVTFLYSTLVISSYYSRIEEQELYNIEYKNKYF